MPERNFHRGEIIRKIIHWKAGKSCYFLCNGQNRWKTNTYNPLFLKKNTASTKENNYSNNNFSIYLYKIELIIFEFRNKFFKFLFINTNNLQVILFLIYLHKHSFISKFSRNQSSSPTKFINQILILISNKLLFLNY